MIRLCEGLLLLRNKTEIHCRCLLRFTQKNFFRARARISVTRDDIIDMVKNERWVVGIFRCMDYTHKRDMHIYAFTSYERGTSKVFELDEFETWVIDVSVIRVDAEDGSPPHFYRFD